MSEAVPHSFVCGTSGPLHKGMVVLLLFLGLAVSSSPVRALEVLTVCDSITQGFQRTGSNQVYGKTTPGNGAANVGGLQSRLNTLLDQNIEPSNVYNWGIGGENSNQTVGRIQSVLDSRPADYLLILCGANDIYQGVSDNATRTNIQFMVQQSQQRGVVAMISELTPNTSEQVRDQLVCDNYNPRIRDLNFEPELYGIDKPPLAWLYGMGNDALCGSTSGWVSDMRKCWTGGSGCPAALTSGDGLHVSDSGYQVMAQIWFEVIRENRGFSIAPVIVPLLLD